jgi:asparagine synthase (glutamine-hydrolysing)
MCGIAGVFGIHSQITPENVCCAVDRMTAALFKRGPDGQGIYRTERAVLGHRRLAIIDTSEAGAQPLSNETGDVWVTYNGEIYNFLELRDLLARSGHTFKSHTDTEVLVHGYEEWGIEDLLKRLRGMFAFALCDSRPSPSGPRIILVRDRVGIKPLYYSCPDDNLLVFASEVQAIETTGLVPSDENSNAILAFLLFGSVPNPWTTLRSVAALPAGHYLSADSRGIHIKRYHDVAAGFLEGPRAPFSNLKVIEDEIRHLLDETVARHLISDAPLGVFLSGGVDSSALVALASLHRQRLVTLGVVFGEEGYSEGSFQKVVASRFQTEHQQVTVTQADFRRELDTFWGALDQPTIDGLNTYFVAGAAKKAGLKAALSGLGGDEIFRGYPTLRRARPLQCLSELPDVLRRSVISMASVTSAYRKLAFLKGKRNLPVYLVQRGLFLPVEAARLLNCEERQAWKVIESLEPDRVPDNPVLRQQFLEAKHYLTDQLLKDADVFGMAHSVEVRVPFLDHILMDKILSIPADAMAGGKTLKPLLTKPLKDLLPEAITSRRKRGFTLPMDAWLRDGYARFEMGGGKVDPSEYERVWNGFTQRKIHWSRPWALAVLNKFCGRKKAS